MNSLNLITHSPEQTRQLGRVIGELAAPGDVFLLSGDLGAGKTCLTQGIAWGLNIDEYTLSPSFVIMRELYGRMPLYHMDLYRLDHIEEIEDLGLDEYFYGKGISVVEWAEKGQGILPPEHMLIKVSHLSENEREFTITPFGEHYIVMLTTIKESLPCT